MQYITMLLALLSLTGCTIVTKKPDAPIAPLDQIKEKHYSCTLQLVDREIDAAVAENACSNIFRRNLNGK